MESELSVKGAKGQGSREEGLAHQLLSVLHLLMEVVELR